MNDTQASLFAMDIPMMFVWFGTFLWVGLFENENDIVQHTMLYFAIGGMVLTIVSIGLGWWMRSNGHTSKRLTFVLFAPFVSYILFFVAFIVLIYIF